MILGFPRGLAVSAVQLLSKVDYTVANRVTEDVAQTVSWAYEHDLPQLATVCIHSLKFWDDMGSLLIAMVVWIVSHTH